MSLNFILHWNFKCDQEFSVQEKENKLYHGIWLSEKVKVRHKKDDHGELLWIGDLVLPEGYDTEDVFIDGVLTDFDPMKVIRAGGHFYCIFIDHQKNQAFILTGFGGILPVYYYKTDDTIFISSSVDRIISIMDSSPAFSARFVVEELLFNYPLFNQSLYEGILMLPAHHQLILGEYCKIERYFDPASFMVEKPAKGSKQLNRLTDFFYQRVLKYFPDQSFALSFTGGFDGRSLLACARRARKKFVAYAFGTHRSPDLYIPKKQAEKLGISFLPFYLDEPAYLKKAMGFGEKMVSQSFGMADMARAHYVYAAEDLSGSYNYLLTGNFGSELFRAMHNTGEMISPLTYRLFNGGQPGEILDSFIMNNPVLNVQNQKIKEALRSLKTDLEEWSLINNNNGQQINVRFYRFVLEDVFRKYFGPEIVMQSDYLINRTPFLDFQFVEQLFKTRYCGIYSDFYEHIPSKRKKGQLFYAYLIKNADKKIYKIKTGKGYSPATLVHPLGNIMLIINLFRKKMFYRGKSEDDPFAVKKVFLQNVNRYASIPLSSFFNAADIFKRVACPEGNHKFLIKVLSLNWLFNQQNKNHAR